MLTSLCFNDEQALVLYLAVLRLETGGGIAEILRSELQKRFEDIIKGSKAGDEVKKLWIATYTDNGKFKADMGTLVAKLLGDGPEPASTAVTPAIKKPTAKSKPTGRKK